MQFSSGSGYDSSGYPPAGGQPPGYCGYGQPPGAFVPHDQGPQPTSGVKAIGIISIILGAICSVCMCFGLVGTAMPQPQQQTTGAPQNIQQLNDDMQLLTSKTKGAEVPMIILGEVMAILLIISGIGTLKLAAWGRMLGLLYAGVEVVSTIVQLIIYAVMLLPLQSQLKSPMGPLIMYLMIFIGPLISLIYPVVLLIFYTRPGVKAQFGAGGGDRGYGPGPGGPGGHGGPGGPGGSGGMNETASWSTPPAPQSPGAYPPPQQQPGAPGTSGGYPPPPPGGTPGGYPPPPPPPGETPGGAA